MSRPKFVPGKVMEFTRKIREIVEQTDCGYHKVPVGIPCYHLRMDSQAGYYAGICNVRAKKIYDGVPTRNTRNSHKEKR